MTCEAQESIVGKVRAWNQIPDKRLIAVSHHSRDCRGLDLAALIFHSCPHCFFVNA